MADAVANTVHSDINVTYAKSIPRARLQVPVIRAFASDGWHVIDKSHRIYRLATLRKKSVFAWVATPDPLRVARPQVRYGGLMAIGWTTIPWLKPVLNMKCEVRT